MTHRRAAVGAAALLGWFALTVQMILVLIGRWQEQASLIGGLINLYGYFTITSNTLVAVLLTQAAFGRAGPAQRWFTSAPVASGITVSILLVSLAYNLLLRHLWHPEGWHRVTDELLHDIMPLICLLYWWFEVPKGHLRAWHLAAWCAYPAIYFLYALWRGQNIGVYAYPFIDVAKLGFAQVMVNALGVLAGFCLIGAVLMLLDRWRGSGNG